MKCTKSSIQVMQADYAMQDVFMSKAVTQRKGKIVSLTVKIQISYMKIQTNHDCT